MSNPVPVAAVPRLPIRVGLVIAGVLLATVFALSLPDDFLWQRVIEDSGHGPVFVGFAIVLLWMLAPPPGQPVRGATQYLLVFGIAIAFAVLTELGQWFMPERNVSARDVLHDAVGAALGLALAWIVERRLARRRAVGRREDYAAIAWAVALAAFAVLAWQPLQCARVYAARSAAWPTLLPLGEPADAAFGRAHAAQASYAALPEPYRRADDGESLRLVFAAGARPGWQVLEPMHDWSAAGILVLDLTNPAPRPVRMTLRVFDAGHDWSHADRFNQSVVLPAATRSTVRISLPAIAMAPRGRRMDMTRIANVMLFASGPLPAGELYLTRVAVE